MFAGCQSGGIAGGDALRGIRLDDEGALPPAVRRHSGSGGSNNNLARGSFFSSAAMRDTRRSAVKLERKLARSRAHK